MECSETINILLMIIAGGTILNGLILVVGICSIVSYLYNIWEILLVGFGAILDDNLDADPK